VNGVNGHDSEHEEPQPVVRGVINDISVFERGDRGKDGASIVVAVGKEHRMGRWKKVQGKNGAVVFEVPKIERLNLNGVAVTSEDEE
jgi:ribosomal RNA-processing protein 9